MGGDSAHDVAILNNGDVVMCGLVQSNPSTFGNVSFTALSSSGKDHYVWRMSAEGTTMWAVSGKVVQVDPSC